MERTAGADPDDHTASNESCHAVTADNELVKQLNANLFALQQYKDAAASHTRKAAKQIKAKKASRELVVYPTGRGERLHPLIRAIVSCRVQ